METATVTCHTATCPKADEPVPGVPVSSTDEDGGERYVDAVACGACGQTITDVVPPLPERETPT